MDNIKISKFVAGLDLDKNRKKLLITFIEELIKESTESDYKLPLASANTRGGIKSGYQQNGKNYPQYQVNLGYDPLLAGVNSPVDYVAQLDNQIQQLNIAKNQIQSQLNNPAQTNQQHFTEQKINLWDEIDKEVSSLNNDQQSILAKDEVYNKLSGELQMLIQEELINSVKDKVANSPRGKELLEKQLNNIRTKKDSIIEEANRELELFKKFQIAAQANPKLTYVEFCKTINNE